MSGTVAIIDYGSGNLHSAQKAFERAAEGTGQVILVTGRPEEVETAERIVLPGVGAFADCLAGLQNVPGMIETLERKVRAGGTPFFGICVGMQLLAEIGHEKGDHEGLGWIGGRVEKIVPGDPGLKVPHMGWNSLVAADGTHPLFAGIPLGPEGLHAYFVHSYHLVARDPADVLATADYGGPITAAVGRENVFGTQFHPEKSQTLGLALIGNFLTWRP